MLNFIVNERSGRGRGKKYLKKIRSFCDKNSILYTIYITNAPQHATELAKDLSKKTDKLIAVGGDGTFSEVVNGCDFSNCAVGFIPSGRGNDYARAAGLEKNPIRALSNILNGTVVEKDFFVVGDGENERRCLNVAGSGLDVSVLERVAGRRGALTYIKSLVWCLFNFKPFRFNISIENDGETQDISHLSESCIMAGVCNGTHFGGGIKLSPHSKIDDGKLNLIIMRKPKRNILGALLTFKSGKHMKKYYTSHFICDSVKISASNPNNPYPIQIDGDIFTSLPLSCKMVKGGLKTFAPPASS